MDKTAIRNFAIEARKILMKSAIAEAGFYGISKDGVKAPIQKGKDFEVYETLAGTEKRIFGDDIKRRENLANAVKELGFEQVIEETAYTWFNRIIAIRFMEVNNYLPTRVRVLSSETGSSTPDIVTQADTVELNMSATELESVQQAKQDNKYDEAFRLLFIKQCNELNAILPGLFEKTNDYMELLLKIPYTGDGVVRMLIDTIPEDNFNVDTEGQVEIIGWMYQYYNTELKDDTFAKLKKNVKITKERIPAATQLFTPDWIVRYMVENSLGRVWIEHLRAVDSSVDEKSKAEEFGWKYYLPEAEQEENVAAQLVDIRASYKSLTPQDITCIDPCMGSGHILVYMFDVLMDIYRSEGFSEREAVFDILEKNIRGLDIDRRAYQLSYFALMMKARGYNRIFFRGHENLDGERVQAVPQVYAIEESNSINRDQLQYFGSSMSEIERNCAIGELTGLLVQLVDAKEYGSILNIESYNWKLLKRFVSDLEFSGQMNLGMVGIEKSQIKINLLIHIGEVLASKYDIAITNPPYMSSSGMGKKIFDYVKKNYDDGRNDLYTVFVIKCTEMVKNNGLVAMITQLGWLSLTRSFRLRERIYGKNYFINMTHLGAHVFEELSGEVVKTNAYVLRRGINDKYSAVFCKLDQCGSNEEREDKLIKKEYLYTASLYDTKKIEGAPLSYWLPRKILPFFEREVIGDTFVCRAGMQTGDNEQFLRCWYEVDKNAISHFGEGKRWFSYNKGGPQKKWYGNVDLVVNWENDGHDIKAFKKHRLELGEIEKKNSECWNSEYYFKQGATWSSIASGSPMFRYTSEESIFDIKGPTCFRGEECSEDKLYYVLGFLNTPVVSTILDVLSPTLDCNPGTVSRLPFIYDLENASEIISKTKQCIDISKSDWDSYENSWDFQRHPLVPRQRESSLRIEDLYTEWEGLTIHRHQQLRLLEEQINAFFINLYGLENEIDSKVDDDKITIHLANSQYEIKTLILYAVGCMFGRYSIKEDGLIYAGGKWDRSKELYGNYMPDSDGIIPITDEEYLNDDIVSRFIEWLEVVYGEEHLYENLSYITSTLKLKGTNDKEKIRNYFLNDFYKDECNFYSVSGQGKRPIYWLFDAGKENGFKCLVYMHRFSNDTLGIIRTDYLLKVQLAKENALKNAEFVIATSSSTVDKAQANKKKDKYIKQLAEIKMYYQALSHMALKRIGIDLDLGCKCNYEKFQGIEVASENEKMKSIDLLAKI